MIAIYLLIAAHTITTLIFGYVLRELDEKENVGYNVVSDSRLIMYFIIFAEILSLFILISKLTPCNQ